MLGVVLVEGTLYKAPRQEEDFSWLPTQAQDREFTEQDRGIHRLPTNRRRLPRHRKAQVQPQLCAHEVSPPEMNHSGSASHMEAAISSLLNLPVKL